MHNTDTEIEFSPDQLAIREQVAAQLRTAQRIAAPFDPTHSVAVQSPSSPKTKRRSKGTGSFYFSTSKKQWIGRLRQHGQRHEVYGHSREEVEAKLARALAPTPEVSTARLAEESSTAAFERARVKAAAQELNRERYPEPNPYVPSNRRPRGTGWIGFDKDRNRWRGQLRQNGQNIQVYGHSREEIEAKLKQTRTSGLHTSNYRIEVILTIQAESIDAALESVRELTKTTEILSIRKGKT